MPLGDGWEQDRGVVGFSRKWGRRGNAGEFVSSMEIMESRRRIVGSWMETFWGHREIWELHDGSAVFSMEVWGWIEMLGWLEALDLRGGLWGGWRFWCRWGIMV